MIRVSHYVAAAGLLVAAASVALPVKALQSDSQPGGRGGEVRSKEASAVSTMTSDELRFLSLLNRERAERHLIELKPDPLLVSIAREHSREMCEKNYFDHLSPTPGLKTPMDRYLRAVPHRPLHACVGENLFYCSIVDVDRGHRALMNSPEHRENILYPPFRRGGIGVYKSDTGEFWVTEMFLTTES